MIVPIYIDTNDIARQFALSADTIEQMMDNIAKGLGITYFTKLEEEVSQSLHSSRSRYLKNIKVVDSGRLQSTIVLDFSKDPLIQMIEEGKSAFDMKQGFLASPKAKMSKKGKRHLTIPLRWGVPGTVGDEGMTSMPQEVYDIVRKKPTTGLFGGGVSKPLTIGEIPKEYQVPQVRKPIISTENVTLFEEYRNKTSLYAGMVRTVDSVTGQGMYNTFRRVSENSDKDAWVHPGIVARNLFNKAYGRMNLEEEMTYQLDRELSKLGF